MTASAHVVVVGMGQLNALWAHGALRAGMTVTPVLRNTPRPWPLWGVPPGSPLLLGTGEAALESVWPHVPPDRRADVVFMQNELFPSAWQAWGVPSPTVMVVWLNRKADSAPRPGPPTQLHGPHADTLAAIHRTLGLECSILESEPSLRSALTAKYAFILTLNALGHHTARTLGEWCTADRPTVEALVEDALRPVSYTHLTLPTIYSV